MKQPRAASPATHSIAANDEPLGRSLHDEVARRAFDSILVRIVVHDRMLAVEIVPRRRRGNTPLQRSPIPRIFRSRLSLEAAVDQVREKDELGSARDKRRN